MCFFEVAISEKSRSSHLQSEGGVKSLRTEGGLKNFSSGERGRYQFGGGYFCWGVSTPLLLYLSKSY